MLYVTYISYICYICVIYIKRNIYKKTQYSTDVVTDTDIPIFDTSKSPIMSKGPFNTTDEQENEMMASRWRVIHFHHVFPENIQKHVSPCGRFFAELVRTDEM